MGQRAHNRRHEGRAIRKERREMMKAIEALPQIAEAFSAMAEGILTGFAKLISDVTHAIDEFVGTMFGYGYGHDVLVIQESPMTYEQQRELYEKWAAHRRKSDYALWPPISHVEDDQFRARAALAGPIIAPLSITQKPAHPEG
ncbi:hypothetical protein PBI_DEWDROP_87 [Microbacterium phage Dewdrop]|nr:hypothetical protein PBI_LEAF_87 [Microbacterium phage Leaf]QGZ17455.1 hypothetical protein PBI_DEWDROP_87 [Microbacterium phage Dewdrop]